MIVHSEERLISAIMHFRLIEIAFSQRLAYMFKQHIFS